MIFDLLVYLKVKPRTALERIRKRGRKEEKATTVQFLESLDKKHEEWLHPAIEPCKIPCFEIDGNQSLEDIHATATKIDLQFNEVRLEY
jgi:thymidylate kinase